MLHIDWRTQSSSELAAWCVERHFHADLLCSSQQHPAFDYRSRVISGSIVTLARTRCVGSFKLRRGWDHIRQDAEVKFTIYYPLKRELRVAQNGTEQVVAPGEFLILRSDNPLRMQSLGDAENPFEMLYVTVPTHMLRKALCEVDRVCGRKIPLGPGLGRASRDLLAQDIFTALNVDPILNERMLSSAIEFSLEALAQAVRAHVGDALEPVDLRQAHLERVQGVIARDLGNKELSAGSVAAACGISRRYLHMVMARSGVSFAQYLWAERLDQAKEWLQADDHRHLTIEQIASLTGFASSSHFSRVFKRRFGHAPRTARMAGGVPLLN